jgi:branched-subunit amino acid transport protein
MKNCIHVLQTWLLAHLFHPFLFSLYLIIKGDDFAGGAIPVMFVMGPILSIPLFALLYLWFQYLNRIQLHPLLKQGLWMSFVPFAILANMLLLNFLIDDRFFQWHEAPALIPALLALWIAMLLRTYQFQDHFISKTIQHENDLV